MLSLPKLMETPLILCYCNDFALITASVIQKLRVKNFGFVRERNKLSAQKLPGKGYFPNPMDKPGYTFTRKWPHRAWITEIKSCKKCQAKWDNIAILFSCKVKSSSFSSFKTLNVDINVSVRNSVRLFSKSIQHWPFSLGYTNFQNCPDVHHLILKQ